MAKEVRENLDRAKGKKSVTKTTITVGIIITGTIIETGTTATIKTMTTTIKMATMTMDTAITTINYPASL